MMTLSSTVSIPQVLQASEITFLVYGALLSEASSRLTFPDLQDFRLVRVHGWRRVFAHPHLFLLNYPHTKLVDGLCLASLSVEPDPSSSFVAAAFRVQLSDAQRQAFVERERGYDFVAIPYYDLHLPTPPPVDMPVESTSATSTPSTTSTTIPPPPSSSPPLGMGVICTQSTDEQQKELVAQLPSTLPYQSIWAWPMDSGLLPADLYLRHCLLAVEKAHLVESFCQDTYLADRRTTLQDYLQDPNVYERVMNTRPPPELATRFGG